MANVPKPLLGVLLAAIAFFAVWNFALKPGSNGSKSSEAPAAAPAPPAATAPVKRAVAAATHRATGSATETSIVSRRASTTKPATSHPHQAASSGPSAVTAALLGHKVVALLFYNPAAADDQAMNQELSGISTDGGQVVKVAAPLTDLSSYSMVTDEVPVSTSPTLVLIDRERRASMIVGFADTLEIEQHISAALATP